MDKFAIDPQSLALPAMLALFAVFNPISSFKAVSRQTSGKWRYVVYPAFVLSHGAAATFDPFLMVLLSATFPGALSTLLESYYFVFGKPNSPVLPPLLYSGKNTSEGAMSYIKSNNPTVSEFVVLAENLYGFETVYATLTSPYVRLSDDGKLSCIDADL